ncbi:MAG TPA: SRPBCC family protein [Dehalococcoidales bacterium]|nr:SRPBCC family protein [Dehalococcoidales bacterium]
MNTKSIRQSVTFKASPHEVYEALMDSRKHAKFTGGKATISRKVNGKFSVFDGYAEGTNLELIPDSKIVQSWRAGDWPEGHYSKVTFSITEVDGVTRLAFTQNNIPAEFRDDIANGWHDYYWEPMKKLLKSKN